MKRTANKPANEERKNWQRMAERTYGFQKKHVSLFKTSFLQRLKARTIALKFMERRLQWNKHGEHEQIKRRKQLTSKSLPRLRGLGEDFST